MKILYIGCNDISKHAVLQDVMEHAVNKFKKNAYIHTYIRTDRHFVDPLVCHKYSRMWNKSYIHKYTNLECKTLHTFYENSIINHHSFSILSDGRSKASSKTIPPHSAT